MSETDYISTTNQGDVVSLVGVTKGWEELDQMEMGDCVQQQGHNGLRKWIFLPDNTWTFQKVHMFKCYGTLLYEQFFSEVYVEHGWICFQETYETGAVNWRSCLQSWHLVKWHPRQRAPWSRSQLPPALHVHISSVFPSPHPAPPPAPSMLLFSSFFHILSYIPAYSCILLKQESGLC